MSVIETIFNLGNIMIREDEDGTYLDTCLENLNNKFYRGGHQSFKEAWENCTDLELMLQIAYGAFVDERKIMAILLLYAQKWVPYMTDERSIKAMEVAKSFALGLATREEFYAAGNEADKAYTSFLDKNGLEETNEKIAVVISSVIFQMDFHRLEGVVHFIQYFDKTPGLTDNDKKEILMKCHDILTQEVYKNIDDRLSLEEKIYEIEGKKVILDVHLARIYGMTVKKLRQFIATKLNYPWILKIDRDEIMRICPINRPQFACELYHCAWLATHFDDIEKNMQAIQEIIQLIPASEKKSENYENMFEKLRIFYDAKNRSLLNKVVAHQQLIEVCSDEFFWQGEEEVSKENMEKRVDELGRAILDIDTV